jgi:hypothetical protein
MPCSPVQQSVMYSMLAALSQQENLVLCQHTDRSCGHSSQRNCRMLFPPCKDGLDGSSSRSEHAGCKRLTVHHDENGEIEGEHSLRSGRIELFISLTYHLACSNIMATFNVSPHDKINLPNQRPTNWIALGSAPPSQGGYGSPAYTRDDGGGAATDGLFSK